jgi:hypothetical protein
MSEPAARLRVDVAARPDPYLLRTAISARLAGRSWPAGPEMAVADAVASAVAAQVSSSGGDRP